MLASSQPLNSLVLKVPHHGGDTSLTPPFLQAVDPQLALIPVGADNRFGHPGKLALRKLQDIPTYRTDQPHHGVLHEALASAMIGTAQWKWMKRLSNPLRRKVLSLPRAAFPTLAVVVLLLGLLFPAPPARGQVTASSEPPPQPSSPSASLQDGFPRVEVVTSTSEEIVLEVTIPVVTQEGAQQDGTAYQRLSLPNSGTTTEIGKPELPAFGRFVAVPRGADLEVVVLDETVETSAGYLLYPAQQPRIDQDEEPDFVIDLASYERDEYYPTRIVELEEPAIIRGVEVVLVRFYPVQYNAAREQLRIHTRFGVRISYSGGAGTLSDERLRSPYFDSLLSSVLLNYSQLGPPPGPGGGSGLAGTNGGDFLIITAPAFLTHANRLADWKIFRGIDTEVRTTAQTGSSASAIGSYIQEAYETWNPPPSFVLFLGDAEFINTNYVTVHPYQGTLTGTDLYYATVDGSDYFPDISTGRISVDTAAEAQNIVGRIVNYERNPTRSGTFYTDLSVAAHFEDEVSPYTQEDRRWVQTSQEIADYVEANGYVAYQIYYAHPWVNPLYFFNGDPLPYYLLKDNGFPWMGNSTHVVDAVNTGRFILNHRDHGVRWMWVQPEFAVWHIQGLNNGRKLPVVFSMNCETGWFDNETDDPIHGTDYNEINFAEAWQRNSNGGAAGVVAATRASYGGYNDDLNKGFYDAIWPDFLPYSPSPGPFSNPQYRMGQVLNYGKLYMATIYGDGIYRQITFETFHYFGDPTMEIWTARPRALTVSHAPVVLTSAPSLTVSVAQDGALVSLVKDGEILGTAVSSGGSATITFSSPLTPGPTSATVTRHNHRPYEGTVTALETIIPHQLPLVMSG